MLARILSRNEPGAMTHSAPLSFDDPAWTPIIPDALPAALRDRVHARAWRRKLEAKLQKIDYRRMKPAQRKRLQEAIDRGFELVTDFERRQMPKARADRILHLFTVILTGDVKIPCQAYIAYVCDCCRGWVNELLNHDEHVRASVSKESRGRSSRWCFKTCKYAVQRTAPYVQRLFRAGARHALKHYAAGLEARAIAKLERYERALKAHAIAAPPPAELAPAEEYSQLARA